MSAYNLRMISQVRRALLCSQMFLRCHFSIDNYMRNIKPEQVTRHHGIFRVDQNSHLSDFDSVKTILNQETLSLQKHEQKWADRAKLYYEKSSSRKDFRNKSIPEEYDQWMYLTKAGWIHEQEYTLIYRYPRGRSNEEKLVLDIMKLPFVKKYSKTAELTKTSFSPSHRYIAFGVDLHNNEQCIFSIMDTQTNTLLDINRDSKLRGVSNLVFGSETEIYYLRQEKHRPNVLYSMKLDNRETVEHYREEDEQNYLDIRKTKDGKYIILSSASKQSCQLRVLKIETGQFLTILPRKAGDKAFVEHVEDYFLLWIQNSRQSGQITLISDAQLTDFFLKKTKKKFVDFRALQGKSVHCCASDESLKDIDVFKDYIVLYLVKFSQPVLRILHIKNEIELFEPKLPLEVGTITPGTNHGYHTKKVLFYQSSPIVYNQGAEYDIETRQFTIIDPFQLTGPKFNSRWYTVETVKVPSTTCEYVPLTLVWKKPLVMNPIPRKCQLHVYGCYGIDNSPEYSNANLLALENDWIIAYAHVRGGGQCGVQWSDMKGENKAKRERSWIDLEEVVAYMLRRELTHPSLIFLISHSAGAITVFNSILRQPHLYKGVILHYPFLDMLGTLLNCKQAMTQADYPEFGNPLASTQQYRSIEAISPYENIRKQEYPLIHIIAGANDYRCPLDQIVRFLVRFRRLALTNGRLSPEGVIGDKNISVRVEAEGSHLGLPSAAEENLKSCKLLAMMDYIIDQASLDCSRV